MKKTSKILALTLCFLISCIVESHEASAGIFGPSNEQECNQKAAKAQTELATRWLAQSCNNIFKDYNYDDYMRSKKVTSNWSDPKSGFTLSEDNQLFVFPSQDELIKYLKKKFQAYKEYKVDFAKCVIDLDGLYEAKNDVAARLVFSNSKCNQIHEEEVPTEFGLTVLEPIPSQQAHPNKNE